MIVDVCVSEPREQSTYPLGRFVGRKATAGRTKRNGDGGSFEESSHVDK